ncbi:MAG: hypothetical protein LLF87_05595 [Eubacteriales bacterium]|nr:hypothetical protein [Eubacteriales bacterium]
MKRFLAFFLGIVFVLSGCSQSGLTGITPEPTLVFPGFKEGEPHASTMGYRSYFETFTVAVGSCTLAIQNKVFNDDLGFTLWEKVAKDLSAVSLVSPAEFSEFTVYVVDKTLAGCIQVINGSVYCTPEDITSGAYREALVRLAMGFSEPWKGVGLAGYIFGEALDEAFLRSYYSEAEDLDALSLFAAYFIDAFATEEELNIAKQTAVSLTTYIIENYGIEQFLAENGQSHKQGWLTALGVEREYADPYAGCFDGYRYSVTKEYPLVVTTKRNDVFFIKPVTHDTGGYGYQSDFYTGSDFDTPQYVMSFLYKAEADIQAVLNGIAKEAPAYLQTVLDNYEEPISVYCGKSKSFAWPDQRKIEIADGKTFVHETVHLLFPYRVSYSAAIWKYETIPHYLELLFTDIGDEDRAETYKLLTEDNWVEAYYGDDPQVRDHLEELTEYYALVKKIYSAYTGMPETPDDVDLITFYRSCGDAELYQYAVEGITLFRSTPLAELYPYAVVSGSGNELTESELHSFREFLVMKYSLSNYIGFCLDELSFEDAFGMSYSEAKEAWTAYVCAFVNDIR